MISLKQEDLITVTEALILVEAYKREALSARAFGVFSNTWLPEAIKQINANEFKLNHPKKNVFVWLIDQIEHCNVLSQGVKHQYGYPLSKTKTGVAAIDICRAAAQGTAAYKNNAAQTTFKSLFY